jgi:hypothetical protein
MIVRFGLQHGLATILRKTLEDLANLPFARGNPLPVRRLPDGHPRLRHRSLTKFAQTPIKDVLVHQRLQKVRPPPHHKPFAKKNGDARRR